MAVSGFEQVLHFNLELAEYENGGEYYKMHGKKLEVIPEKYSDRPSSEYLEWHNSLFVS